jgi:lipopolysaccharide transport system ATP-binding protein
MSDPVIKVENLGKKYLISHLADNREQLFSRLLVNKVKDLVGRGKKVLSSPFSIHHSPFTDSQEEFWALKDVSFEVKQGDRVGIIGRNGAGKSTLLKILSRITEPTKGRLTIDGRVASLLEVGTGFHSELTGRENIYLNGAILGMSMVEIKRKFDEIVAFAEVDRFLDTPVKRYSSGMHVRLAFAVAAHLEPEILIVDEVLAVGDAQFQKKCLGKMEDVSSREGRTVLFVSHNMGTISSLCNKVILLDKGAVRFDGETQQGIDFYLETASSQSYEIDYADRKNHVGKLTFSWIDGVSVFDANGSANPEIRIGEGVRVVINFTLKEDVANLEIGFCIHNMMGQRYSHFLPEWEGASTAYRAGRHRLECEIPALFLLPGGYEVSVWIKRKGGPQDDSVDSAGRFTVIGADINGHQPDFERYPNLGIYTRSNWTRREP